MMTGYFGFSQNIHANWFIRNVHVVNQNFTNKSIYYSPIIGTGIGLSHGTKFIELGLFINKGDNFGAFTFFGSTLKSSPLDENWTLYTNWFGELSYFPKQENNKPFWIQTGGLCFFINRNLKWGSIGFPLCIGGAYSESAWNLNARAILNLSITLK